MNRYAQGSNVSMARSREEIERMIRRYGAEQFVYGWDEGHAAAIVGFKVSGRSVRLKIPIPHEEDFAHSPGGKRRAQAAATAAFEAECRRRWRVMALVLKAKFEAVAAGVTSFEEEFLAHILLLKNQTVGDVMIPRMEEISKAGKLPALPGMVEG